MTKRNAYSDVETDLNKAIEEVNFDALELNLMTPLRSFVEQYREP